MTRENWEVVKLGKHIKIKHGFAFKGEFFCSQNESKYILLTPGNFTEKDGLVLKGDKEKHYKGEIPKEYILNEGDLIIAMTDLKQSAPYLGAPGVVKESDLMLHNQRLGLVEFISDKIDKHYCYYLFHGSHYRGEVRGSATGSTVRHTAPERIYKIEISLPPLHEQKRIASILSAYDDLIENNTSRITLLEQMAQTLYRQWFVEYKFPGYQNVEMVESETEFGMIPSGWEVKKIGDEVLVRKGKNITLNTIIPGDIPVVAGGLNPAYYHNTPNVKGPVITISASGANSGYVNLYNTDIWASDCGYIDGISTSYIFYWYIQLKVRQNEITHLQKGAAQPHVYPSDVMEVLFIKPNYTILEDFEKIISRYFIEVGSLEKQNQSLKEQRDLLLRKLIG